MRRTRDARVTATLFRILREATRNAGQPVGACGVGAAKLEQRLPDQDLLLRVPHLQRARFLLLYCGAPRCTHLLLRILPADVEEFASQRDAAVGRRTDPNAGCKRAPCPAPFAHRGLGLGLATMQRNATPGPPERTRFACPGPVPSGRARRPRFAC